ncbi:BMP family ABC transporter substrate-binding protein [Geminicoccaceae bacterium 1502E]|nr:BMP family ABC transporter substrate-binding protein [Geminicoccaceae bacterium 1502E]
MTLILNRRLLLGGAAAAAALGGIRPIMAEEPLKIGFVYVGPVGDHGWSYQHDQGRLAVEKEFGEKVKTSFVENVSEGPDAERVIRQLASSGHELIFTTSFGFMNATARVAKQFPKVKFEHATGYTRAANLATYDGRFYEGRCVIGTIAGRMTKTNKIGYIGSFPIPEVVQGINAFTLAARKVNPDVEVRVIWASTWYDPGKEADAAKAHIDQGADIIVQHTDSPAALQVAEERGLMAFGQASDMSKFAPNAQLTAIVDNWSPYYIKRVQAVLDGSWKSHAVWLGLKDGEVAIAPYGPKVPPEVAAEADEVQQAIIAGTRHPFDGPITDRDGKERAPAGRHLTDEELTKMDWYVPGVQG